MNTRMHTSYVSCKITVLLPPPRCTSISGAPLTPRGEQSPPQTRSFGEGWGGLP